MGSRVGSQVSRVALQVCRRMFRIQCGVRVTMVGAYKSKEMCLYPPADLARLTDWKASDINQLIEHRWYFLFRICHTFLWQFLAELPSWSRLKIELPRWSCVYWNSKVIIEFPVFVASWFLPWCFINGWHFMCICIKNQEEASTQQHQHSLWHLRVIFNEHHSGRRSWWTNWKSVATALLLAAADCLIHISAAAFHDKTHNLREK